ncbi:MAG: hypothetical protein ACXAB8_09255 [Promethearchaeota archaeon]
MKRKQLLIGILFLFLFTSRKISNVNAMNYGIGVNQNENLVWNCKVSNNAEMDNIFGTEWDISGIFTNLSTGSSMKWRINSTEINETVIHITYDIWYWKSGVDWGINDNSSEIDFLVDPNNYPTNFLFLNYTSLVPFLLPLPIGEYLGDLSIKLNDFYDVDNRVLPTLNLHILKDQILPSFPNKDIKIIAIYNDRGILNSYKLYGNDNTVIIDIALNFLPNYVIPTLIGLVITFSIGVTSYIKKKITIRCNPTKNDGKTKSSKTER